MKVDVEEAVGGQGVRPQRAAAEDAAIRRLKEHRIRRLTIIEPDVAVREHVDVASDAEPQIVVYSPGRDHRSAGEAAARRGVEIVPGLSGPDIDIAARVEVDVGSGDGRIDRDAADRSDRRERKLPSGHVDAGGGRHGSDVDRGGTYVDVLDGGLDQASCTGENVDAGEEIDGGARQGGISGAQLMVDSDRAARRNFENAPSR